MSEQRILKGTTPTIVSYPRLRPGGNIVQATATSTPLVKVQTPSETATAFGDAVLDDLRAAVTAPAAAGEIDLAVTVEAVTGFDPDFIVVDAVDAVSSALEALGSDDNVADADAADIIEEGMTVDEFSAAVVAAAATISSHIGHGLTPEELEQLVEAFETATTTTSTPSWVRGRRYLLVFEGHTVVVESRSSGASSTLRLAAPLPCDVPEGGAVSGFAVLRTLTAEETESPGEGSALWQAVINDETVQWSQLFRIVSRMPTALLTYGDLLAAVPPIASLQPPQDLTWDDVINAAWKFRVVPVLDAKKAFDEDVVSDETLVPLHAVACFLHLVEFNDAISDKTREMAAKAWAESLSTTFAAKSYAERPQTDEDVVTPRSPGAEVERGRIRLST